MRAVLRTSDGCLAFGRLELCNLETLQSVAPGILPASVLRESADQSRRDAGATSVETLQPWYKRRASPSPGTPFSVRTGTTASGWLPRYRLHFVSLLNVAHRPLLWCARWGVISAGETGLALACLNPAVARKLWWILQIWCDFPTACGACGALPIARA